MRPTEGPSKPACVFCARPTFDPQKKGTPWVRAVVDGRQVLICPVCQSERPGWADGLDRCGSCGETRLSVMLGEVVCRACGHTQPANAGA